MPNVGAGLQALVDQHNAALRDLLDAYPQFKEQLTTVAESATAARMVVIDTLAALSEAYEESVEHRLDVVTARLLAWDNLTRYA